MKLNADWGAGFCGQIFVTNNGTTALNGWSGTATLPTTGRINNLWSANWSQNGTQVALSSLSWNAKLAPGGSFVGAGFCGLR